MEPGTLGWPFHRGVKASVVLAVKEGKEVGGSGAKESWGKGLCSIGEQEEKEEEGEWGRGVKRKQLGGSYLISISAKLFASAKQ